MVPGIHELLNLCCGTQGEGSKGTTALVGHVPQTSHTLSDSTEFSCNLLQKHIRRKKRFLSFTNYTQGVTVCPQGLLPSACLGSNPHLLFLSPWSLVTVQRERKDSQSQQENKQKQPPFAQLTLQAELRSQGSHSRDFGKFLLRPFISYKDGILHVCLR